ncbi:MAG: S9 family peptidase, partial [Chitinophagaceae bacterium]
MKAIIKPLTVFALLQPMFAQAQTTAEPANKQKIEMEYPDTRQENITDNYFGTTVADPYRWLEDDQSEATKQWVTAQNNVTQNYLSNIPFRNAIKERLTKLMNYERSSQPFKEGDYTYFYRNSGLQNQSVLY